MSMTIRTFWEKTEAAEGERLAKVLRGQYEQKPGGAVFFKNMGGWSSVNEFRADAQKRQGFEGEIQPGVFRFRLQRQWGIDSYQEVSFE